MLRRLPILALLLATAAAPDPPAPPVLLKPARVFDGTEAVTHPGWQVLVADGRIVAVGPALNVPAGTVVVELPGQTLMPGMIEGHGHLFLHPYDEAKWDDQVLHEPLALRTARAVTAARATLAAGFTTERDLGTEGAGYADVGLKRAIAEGIVPGPRMVVATRAIVARGAYGPKGFEPGVEVPQGAQEASGADELVRAIREQIAGGADVVKLYADYRWGPGEPARATFSADELGAAVAAAHDAGRKVAVHAATDEGMRRAVLAGADTIEHGYGGSATTFALMKARGTVFFPTLAAAEASARYVGWNGAEPAPAGVQASRRAVQLARAAGVTIGVGGDAGVFAHGRNARELELLATAGMPAGEVLIAATSGNARAIGMGEKLGAVKPGLAADLIAVAGDPVREVAAVTQVRWVMKAGVVLGK